jgi:hypothetical protein
MAPNDSASNTRLEVLEGRLRELRDIAKNLEGDAQVQRSMERVTAIVQRVREGRDFMTMYSRLMESFVLYGGHSAIFMEDVTAFIRDYYGIDPMTMGPDDMVVLPPCHPKHTVQWVGGLVEGEERIRFKDLFLPEPEPRARQ